MEDKTEGISKDDLNPGYGDMRFGDLVIEPEDDTDDGLFVYIDLIPEAGEELKVKLTNEELSDLYYNLGMFLTHWNRVKKGIGGLPLFENGKRK